MMQIVYSRYFKTNHAPIYARTLILLGILWMTGCAVMPETIRDIHILPQNHEHYLEAERLLLPLNIQQELDNDYNRKYFAPWHQSITAVPREVILRPFYHYLNNPGYGENRRPRTTGWFQQLLDNAQLDGYPNAAYPAITISNTNLRILPTHKPVFRSASGYPFDRLQTSFIAANTPLFISHTSADRAWYRVETPFAHGWIDSRDVAVADLQFIRTWQSGHYAVVIKDKTPLYDQRNRFLYRLQLGSIFPLLDEQGDSVQIMHATADETGRAVIASAIFSREAIAMKPMPMTGSHLAAIANELAGETYGWGGLYQNRDCSAMLRDLFTPFGVWLSRHSEDQAKRDGLFIDLTGLSPEDKLSMIRQQGVPYLTLLWMKGHIMLYIGLHDHAPVIFHNLWSTTSKDYLGRPVYIIVGQAAVTTLHPGQTSGTGILPGNSYLRRIAGMTLLVPPQESNRPDAAASP